MSDTQPKSVVLTPKFDLEQFVFYRKAGDKSLTYEPAQIKNYTPRVSQKETVHRYGIRTYGEFHWDVLEDQLFSFEEFIKRLEEFTARQFQEAVDCNSKLKWYSDITSWPERAEARPL